MNKPKFNLEPLKRQIEEQPLIAAGIGAALLSGGAKFLNAVSNSRNSKTWRREVRRRERKQKQK